MWRTACCFARICTRCLIGYLTVTEELRVEVSTRIHEQFNNGREYYKYHGRLLLVTPRTAAERPAPDLLRWHNENCFLA